MERLKEKFTTIPEKFIVSHLSIASMKLFEPIKIGEIEVKNRIVMPAAELNYHTPDGGVTDKLLEFYRERAKGGIGFAVVGIAKIEPHFLEDLQYMMINTSQI